MTHMRPTAQQPSDALAPSPAKSLFSSTSSKPRLSSINVPNASTEAPTSPESALTRTSISRSISPHVKARWQEGFKQVVFKRHEEILAKDPNRKWRQERFGLLLFAQREYARASEHLNKAVSLGATSSLCWRRLAESLYHVWEGGGEWEVLWACRAAYEQALSHVELSTRIVLTVSEPLGQTPKPKLAHVSVDILFQELYKLATKIPEVAPSHGAKWKSWRDRSETYTAFAEYFRATGESILASDALSRSLELLETLPPESNSSEKSPNLWRGLTDDQRCKRVALYLVLARNYYQCNQMEKAIRSMEAVFDLDPLHAEARASLVEWFPEKWQYRLELEDASQVQIARVLRGIWDRKHALLRRREVIRAAEQWYRENPYHLGCRRQRASYPGRRWLVERTPELYNHCLTSLRRSDASVENAREENFDVFVMPDDSNFSIKVKQPNVFRDFPVDIADHKLLSQHRMLQRLYRRWKSAKYHKHSSLVYVVQAEANELRQTLRELSSALKIQRLWRRYTAGKAVGGRVSSQAQILLVEHFFAAQRRQTVLVADLNHAARKIQTAYRGRLMRRFLQILQRRVLAPPCASAIDTLLAKCERNHQAGTETMAVLHSIDNLNEKRSLFDHPVLVLRGARVIQRPDTPSTDESFSLQHVVSAIKYSQVLKCLICASGDFKGDRILTLLQALQTRRNLRVLALGEISTIAIKAYSIQDSNEQTMAPVTSEWSIRDDNARSEHLSPSTPLVRRLLSLPSPPSSPQPHQKRQLSAMHALSKTLCTSNFLLEELYFERNSLLVKPQEGAVLAGIVADYFFARYGHLHTLVVAHMRFSDANGALLGAALAINTILQKLDLHGNLISDGAAIAIANDGLAHNSTLHYLNLAENRIGSVGGKVLFKCLGSSNRSLQTLILRNNHLMSDVMLPLIEAWQMNAVIEIVELAGNLINDQYLIDFQTASAERREITPAKENQELRLLLARRRFGIRDIRSPISRRGIGLFSSPLSSPGKGGGLKVKKKNTPLSPKKWLSANTPKVISPIAFPMSMDRHSNEVFTATMLPVETVYLPARPRKMQKSGLISHNPVVLRSKLPALSSLPVAAICTVIHSEPHWLPSTAAASVGRPCGDSADPHHEGAHEDEAVLEHDGGSRPRRLLELVVHIRVREHDHGPHERRHGQRHAEDHEAPVANQEYYFVRKTNLASSASMPQSTVLTLAAAVATHLVLLLLLQRLLTSLPTTTTTTAAAAATAFKEYYSVRTGRRRAWRRRPAGT
ncbi:unnamed protein product [Phytophthora fragariaefolia]|uniref:Unnamed protein product n=1 Tax=Phytophthora fragariaefolia TaxID=1490495 RepID=A0A9W6XTC0_9STRA|nr:unnamed protein product [Phytophthora fragariaefolia]